jgi:DNA topoisomerase-1
MLVIVESPSKCAAIAKYLDCRCVATCGHITELNSLNQLDADLNPTFKTIKKQIAMLQREIDKHDEIVLACDNDREGEAICYHVCSLFGLDVKTTKRILFSEVTEVALRYAMANPTTIDMNLVNAQKARQVLDLIVGHKTTPVLWANVPNGDKHLSAGRCQTPALRLVYDNYKESASSVERTVYKVVGQFIKSPFVLKETLATAEEVQRFLSLSIDWSHVYIGNRTSTVIKSAPKPFTTARLLQTASNDLRFSPSDTMKLAQTLYEAGRITYMRTDSEHYCAEFLETVKTFIDKRWGEKWNKQNTNKQNTNKVTQDAHEAIRPTNINWSNNLSGREKRLYELIWNNALESCMDDAVLLKTAHAISAPFSEYEYVSEQTVFPGFLSNRKPTNKEALLMFVKVGSVWKYKKITASAELYGTKSLLTEARLISLLEQKGIGRPSTFASIVDKIQDRGYVVKRDVPPKEVECVDFVLKNNGEIEETRIIKQFNAQKDKLIIQPIGIQTAEFLTNRFPDLFDYAYSCKLEGELDAVASGKERWDVVCRAADFNVDIKSNTVFGMFEGHEVFLKSGKYGLYATFNNTNVPLKSLGNRPMENITFDEVLPFLGQQREISNNLSIRNGKNGDYLYYKMSNMKKPVFFSLTDFPGDYKSCDLHELKVWAKQKYNVF